MYFYHFLKSSIFQGLLIMIFGNRKNKLLLSLGIFLVTGCAYFNVFYNANQAYDMAQREHKELMEDHPDSLYVHPPTGVVSNYQRAIEKSAKMMDLHEESRWNEEGVFLIAKSLYYKGDHFLALRQLRSFQELYPESEHIPLSYLYKAKANIITGNLAKAEEQLEFIVDNFPHMDSDHQITMLLVEVAHRRGGRSQAINLLERILQTPLSDMERARLLLKTAELYIEMGRFERAYGLLNTVPRNRRTRQMPFIYKVDRALLECYMQRDTLDVALEFVGQMVRNRTYFTYRDELLLEMGYILRDMDRTDEAIEVFNRLAREDETDRSTISGKAWIALADIYLRQIGDLEKAGDAYSNAARTTDTSVSNFASRRFDAIKQLELLRNPDSTDTRTQELRDYKVAELFKFELKNPDSAFFQFVKLSQGDWEDTTLIPRSLSMAAIIARSEMGDTLTSDSLFNEVIGNYPVSKYARNAQIIMRAPVTVETDVELADKEYRKAEELYYNEGNTTEAIRVFFNIHRDFPELEIAPKSLYAAAYLTDNELQRNRSAMTLYQRLCELYPESEYCTQMAEPRINAAQNAIDSTQSRAVETRTE